jgi:hypothetical protein
MDSAGISGTAGTTANGYNDMRSAGTANSGSRAPERAPGKAESMGMEREAGSDAMQDWQGVVQMIEPMTRQEAGMDIGAAGALGAAAVGGTIPGVGSERVYRVTLRTDDGAMRSVVVQATPDYKTGDRVTYSPGTGTILRQ